jgi:hypothetical protein
MNIFCRIEWTIGLPDIFMENSGRLVKIQTVQMLKLH